MLKQFAKNTLVYGIATLVSRGISLLLVPLYTRWLSPTEYGVLDIALVSTTLASVLMTLEVAQGLARSYIETDDPDEKASFASTALWFTVGGFTLFVLAGLVALRPLTAWLTGTADAPAIRGDPAVTVAALALVASAGVFYFGQTLLRWELAPMKHAWASIAASAVTVALSVLLVTGMRAGVEGAMWAQTAGNAAGAALGLWFVRGTVARGFSWARCREMLAFSLPLVPSGVGVFVSVYVDRIAIKRLMTLGDVGVFGVGFRIVAVLGLLMSIFQGSLTPLVYKNHRAAETPAQVARIFRLFVAAALLLCAALTLFAREILAVVTTPPYYGAWRVIPLLGPAILLANMYIFTPGLGIARRTGAIAAVNVTAAVLNTALNFVLIPHLGITGAALSTFLSAAGTFAVYMSVGQRLYPIPHHWRALAAGVVATIGVYAAALAAAAWWPAISPALVAAKLLVLVALAAFMAVAGLVSTPELMAARTFLGLARSRLRQGT